EALVLALLQLFAAGYKVGFHVPPQFWHSRALARPPGRSSNTSRPTTRKTNLTYYYTGQEKKEGNSVDYDMLYATFFAKQSIALPWDLRLCGHLLHLGP
ncbi:MAG: hypothetical protein Q4A01_10910, partial [Coriobacteriales bacterium]|nr:hypothetical protein [Coriobacteriales bacterium]